MDISRGYLKGYVKKISSEGKESGITVFPFKDLFQGLFVHVLFVPVNNGFSAVSESWDGPAGRWGDLNTGLMSDSPVMS